MACPPATFRKSDKGAMIGLAVRKPVARASSISGRCGVIPDAGSIPVSLGGKDGNILGSSPKQHQQPGLAPRRAPLSRSTN